MKDPKKQTEAELLECIQKNSELILADVIRLQRPLSDQDKENSQYWYDKRYPNLIAACQELLSRQASQEFPYQKLKTVEDYSDELLINKWEKERALLRDLGDLLSDNRLSPKLQKEREEDHARHSQYIAKIRAEMANRGMFSEDGSLKPEYKKLII